MRKSTVIPNNDNDGVVTYSIDADGTRNYLPMKFILDESGNPRVNWFGKIQIVAKPVEYSSADRIHSPIIVAKVQDHMVASGIMKSHHSVMVFRLPLNDQLVDAIGLDDRNVGTFYTPFPRKDSNGHHCGMCGQVFPVGSRMYANINGDNPICEACEKKANPVMVPNYI